MELRLAHTVGFVYDAAVRASYHEARLTPLSDSRQAVRNPRIDVDPQPWSTTYTDYWGTQVTAFEVLQGHQSLTVTSTATVRTRAAEDPADALGWTDLADPHLLDGLAEFLVVDSLPPADLSSLAGKLVADGVCPGEVAREVCALGALDDAIGALREAGLPCRFVSGYVLGRERPHAWLEWWDGSWQAFDPAIGQVPGEGHVTRAAGRSAADVRPLRGIHTGAGVAEARDSVEISPL